jgi:hypothetical protein
VKLSKLEVEARMSISSKSQILALTLLCAPVVAPVAVTTTNGDSSFQGNRRPGFSEVTDEPTGENALLYRQLGEREEGYLRADELLNLLHETPVNSASAD